MSDCLLMPWCCWEKKRKKCGKPRALALKKYLYGNNMQIGFSDSHKQTCKLHLNCNKNHSLNYDVAKNRPRWNHQQDFFVFPQKAMRVMKDILIFALDFSGGEF